MSVAATATVRGTRLRIALLVLANVIAALAFLWPFLVPGLLGESAPHAEDAPFLLLAVLGCLTVVLFLDLGRGGIGPKGVALIGVLGAAMVALRLPGFVAGFSAMFIIVLVAGNAFGPAFGFVLGAIGLFASGLFLGGIGPWLPFQMAAVGWVGLGAGLLPGAETSWRVRLGALAAYGFVVGYAFGIVMNLWSWPFTTAGTAIGWVPQEDLSENVQHYATYYMTTSFVWDTFRAFGNAAMVLVLGRPLLGALDRAARRMRLDLREPRFIDPPDRAAARPEPAEATNA
ncbi:MAG: ECF transporter S component [Actinomycetota bacterium]